MAHLYSGGRPRNRCPHSEDPHAKFILDHRHLHTLAYPVDLYTGRPAGILTVGPMQRSSSTFGTIPKECSHQALSNEGINLKYSYTGSIRPLNSGWQRASPELKMRRQPLSWNLLWFISFWKGALFQSHSAWFLTLCWCHWKFDADLRYHVWFPCELQYLCRKILAKLLALLPWQEVC
jgi:hypothetical protein